MLTSEIGQELISAVHDLAQEFPDLVYKKPNSYETCHYFRGGQPSCIIGHAAYKLGLIDATIEGEGLNEAGVNELLEQLDIKVSYDELLWLGYAQESQDNGTPWGKVPAAADQGFTVGWG